MLKDSAIFDRYGYRVVIVKNQQTGVYNVSIYRNGNARIIVLSGQSFESAYNNANNWLTANRSN